MALYELIKSKQCATAWELENETRLLGYKISNGERRLRELRNAGLIIKEIKNGAVVGYKISDPVQTKLI
jgi:hypothetical protein